MRQGGRDAALLPQGRTLERRKNEILADPPWRALNGDTEGVHPKIKPKMLLALCSLRSSDRPVTLFDMEPKYGLIFVTFSSKIYP
ncbi:hypothetical protein TR75_05080 [Hydrogenibacillus schlegelii]|uniref:Uncharacterized protein n=1 Tax=Hydrogenibacillus schlegelii TaxID=1484 RepID=A0A132N989_HYDSH|nr:hypothetical protein TR75_05080 [Hydrogenibacillus schlegelii]OAR04005.1 hypothetical protein SA87_00045 [Hydrogenibacillus schlegelii]